MPLATGFRIGPYEVVSKIGEGGMGEVYRARDSRLDRTVAIKIMRADFGDRFEREARAISALNHPRICTLHDVGRTDEFAYLVMEYVDGAPLAGPLPVDDVLKLGMQICDALHAAHQKGIVHRDLKPANILAAKGGIKLLDFGLAKPRTSPSQSSEQATIAALTGAHTILGTPQYMAPEQIEGREADTRTDIFALGCVLYELVTGKRAFEGKTASNVMAAILATEPRRPSELVPITPPALEFLILRCLEKDPDARWQNAHDLRLQLQWIAEHRADGSAEPVVSASRSPLRAYLTGAAIGVVAAGLVAGVWWRVASHRAAPASSPAAPVAMTISMHGKMIVGDVFERSAVALSPDGRTVAFVADEDATDPKPPAIYLRQLDQLDVVKVAGTDGGTAPFFSPDGQWIAFSVYPKLKKVPVGGGMPLDICDIAEGIRGAVWLADDTIAFSTPAGGLRRVPAQGGTPTELTKLNLEKNEKTHRSLVALPGGKTVLFVVGSNEIGTYDDGRIVALTLDTGKITELVTGYAPVFSPSGHLLYVRDATVFAVPFDPVTLKVGSSPLQVLKNVGVQPSYGSAYYDVSANGTLVYVSAGDRRQQNSLRWIDRSGVFTPIPAPERNYSNVHVSPDGKRLAVSIDGANNSLWTFDLVREQLTRITFRHDVGLFAWSGDSTRIVYASGLDLRTVAADGSGREDVLLTAAEAGGLDTAPVGWSADGKTIALTVAASGQPSDVATLSTADRKLTTVVKSRFDEIACDLSPDGRWVLYSSNESGQRQLFVRDLSEGGAKYLVSGERAAQGYWTKQGRELQSVGNVITALSFTPGVPPIFGKPEPIVTKVKSEELDLITSASPAPDGSRHAVVYLKPLPPITEMHVVTNWTPGARLPQ